jgi:UDPglucose 6-dehydrogenase
MQQVAVIGGGYVGLVTAAGLAKLGHRVRVGEIDSKRVEMLRSGQTPIFEEGLPELLGEGAAGGRLTFHTSNTEAVDGAKFVFLCLPTPEGTNGRADLRFIDSVIDELATEVGEGALFVVKSTVPPGTVAGLRKRLADRGSVAGVVSHPEFLREGRAVPDFLEPDRIVVGAYDEGEARSVADLYQDLETTVVVTDPTSAEMIKYASNSYLAARLTFVNTLAILCEAVGADVLDVISGMGLDHRIGPHFLQPGPGYGGSCFPKDTIALIGVAEDAGYDFELLRAVIAADNEQRRRLAEKVRQAAGGGLRGRRIGLWGVAFKAGTDDVRESPALKVAQLLMAEGAEVVAYDPEAVVEGLAMASSPVEAARGADVLLVATEWPEFSTVDMTEVASVMKGYRVVDSRNLLDPSAVRKAGLDYWGLGRPGA